MLCGAGDDKTFSREEQLDDIDDINVESEDLWGSNDVQEQQKDLQVEVADKPVDMMYG